MYNDIPDDGNAMNRLNSTKSRIKMINIFKQLEEIFMEPKADKEADDKAHKKGDEKADRKADEEQPDTTDMPELESEESAEQRRNKKGQGLKTLTSNQMLSRLPVTLAQLIQKSLKMK